MRVANARCTLWQMKNEIRQLMNEVEAELASAGVGKVNWANVLGAKTPLAFEDWTAKILLAEKVRVRKEKMDNACVA